MKSLSYGLAIASLSNAVVAKLTPARGAPAARDAKDLSMRGRNLLARQSYDYCGASSYYCVDSNCCGITYYNCMAPGGQCCDYLSEYGYGLWCNAGTSCTVSNGMVACEDSSGALVSADSTALDQPTATGTDVPLQTDGGSSSSSSNSSGSKKKSTKKKSKAWIAGVVIGPLILFGIIAAVVFFFCVVKKKKNKTTFVPNPQGGAATDQPAMTQQPPIMSSPPPANQPAPQMGISPAPMGQPAQNPDTKSPAYTQQYEVPTPVSSPPPQWTPASPAPMNAQPAVYAYQQQPMSPEQHAQNIPPAVSPMNTGGYAPPPQQPQQQQQYTYPNASEMPAVQAPRSGAHEMHG